MESKSTVRKRTTKTTTPTTSDSEIEVKKTTTTTTKSTSDKASFSFLDVVRMLGGVAILALSLSYLITNGESFTYGYKLAPKIRALKHYFSPPKTFTEEQLWKYNGQDPKLPIYLAINGSVFDVSANRATYGPGGSYHFFAGRDATRAYVTGCFQDDLTHDLRGAEDMFLEEDNELDDFLEGKMKDVSMSRRAWLQEKQKRRRDKALDRVYKAVKHWEDFFFNSDKYPYVGKVIRKSVADKPIPKICRASMRKRDKDRLKREEEEKKMKEEAAKRKAEAKNQN